jgi:hypothetical protein
MYDIVRRGGIIVPFSYEHLDTSNVWCVGVLRWGRSTWYWLARKLLRFLSWFDYVPITSPHVKKYNGYVVLKTVLFDWSIKFAIVLCIWSPISLRTGRRSAVRVVKVTVGSVWAIDLTPLNVWFPVHTYSAFTRFNAVSFYFNTPIQLRNLVVIIDVKTDAWFCGGMLPGKSTFISRI